MKKRMWKQSISVLLVFVVTFTSLSLESVFAAESGETDNMSILATALANYDFSDYTLGDDGNLHYEDAVITLESLGGYPKPELVEDADRGQVLSLTEQKSNADNRGNALLPENPFAGKPTEYGFTLNFWSKTTGTAEQSKCLLDFELAPAAERRAGTFAFNQGAAYWNVTDQLGDSGFTDFNIDNMDFGDTRYWKMVTMTLTSTGIAFYCNGQKIEHSLSDVTVAVGREDYEELLKELAGAGNVCTDPAQTKVRLGASMAQYWPGAGALLDDISFFGKALSDSEVAALYHETCKGMEEISSGDYKIYARQDDSGKKTASITGYFGSGGDVVIPGEIEGYQVVRIEDRVFYGNNSLTSIEAPDSLKEIGSEAFMGCANLAEIKLPQEMANIEWGAFYDCINLKNITLPEGIKRIGWGMFYGSGITSIKLPESVTEMGEKAFWSCSSLKSVEILGKISKIENNAFEECTSLASVKLPQSLKEIGGRAFQNCNSLTDINLPDGVASIGESAFLGCTGLTDIHLPASLTGLGDSAFSVCRGLTSVELPEKLASIGMWAFTDCRNLESVKCGKGLTEIRDYAFSGCTNLVSVELPEGLMDIGREAFAGCSSLTDIKLPKGIVNIKEGTFMGCSSLAEIEFSQGLVTIGKSALWGCSSLTDIILPEGLTAIDGDAFYQCSSLKNVTLPESLTMIDGYAFAECSSLESIRLPGKLKSLGAHAFFRCGNLRSIELPDSLVEIGGEAFGFCGKLEGIKLPDGIRSIESQTFEGCSEMMEVKLPQNLKVINGRAFWGCGNLTSIELPEGLTQIEGDAFSYCGSLTRILMPESLQNISATAFAQGLPEEFTLVVYADSYVENFAKENNLNYEYWNSDNGKIILSMASDTGEKLSDGYTVRWYEADSGKLAGTGSILHNVRAGEVYQYEIRLGEQHCYQYQQPERGSVTTQKGDNTVDVSLEPLGQMKVSGTVKDSDGKAVGDAKIKIKQTYGEGHEKTSEETVDKDGLFSFSAQNVVTQLIISADGYYDNIFQITPDKVKDGAVKIDSSLSSIPENRITMDMFCQYAAKEGEKAKRSRITSASGLEFSVFNKTKNIEISDFKVQFPYLVINDGTDAGDKIEISIVDTDGTMTADAAEVTLDECRSGQVSVTFIQNGYLVLEDISGNDKNTVMIFDKDGKFVEFGIAGNSYTSAPLKAGNYRVAAMSKTSLLPGISQIERLENIGLVKGTDYVQSKVAVSNGVITELIGINVPKLDESKLYYTVPEHTYFVSSYSQITVGQYLTMRAAYQIDSKYQSSVQKVRFEIPSGVEFVENSLTVNGKPIAYSVDGNSLEVHVNDSQGVIRFHVLTVEKGAQTAFAYLDFQKDGSVVTQPIGATSFEICAAEISVPQKTRETSVTITGKAIADSNVTVFDNGVEAGKTVSKKNGSWKLTFELNRPGNYSYHNIFAVIENERYGRKVETDMARLVYDKEYVEVSKLTMINTAHDSVTREFITEFDFQHPSTAVPSYNYWPAYPTFTFKVEFVGENKEKLRDVYVVTKDSQGEKTYVKCAYDEMTDTWIGTHDYMDFADVPASVSVNYKDGSIPVEDEYLALLDSKIHEECSDMYMLCDESSDTVLSGTVHFNKSQKEMPLKMSLESQSLSGYDLAKFKEMGYEEVLKTDDVIYLINRKENLVICIFALKDGGTLNVEAGVKDFTGDDILDVTGGQGSGSVVIPGQGGSGDGGGSGSGGSGSGGSGGGGEEPTPGGGGGEEPTPGGGGEEEPTPGGGGEEEPTPGDRAKVCIRCMPDWEVRKLAEIFNRDQKDIQIELCLKSMKDNVLFKGLYSTANFIPYLTMTPPGIFKETLQNLFSDIVHTSLLSQYEGPTMDDAFKGNMQHLRNLLLKFSNVARSGRTTSGGLYIYECEGLEGCKCGGSNCKCGQGGGGSNNTPDQPMNGQADPSGYVYEAVPSNRLEGVKAEIYQYDYAEDEFGVVKDTKEEILWNAEDYDQKNPLYTDANGTFAWDVPQGQWLVKFSKEGYYDADSRKDAAADEEGYLPVPPIQTEVNTAMVSKAAPKVERVNVYGDEVQITFSQYMKIDTVNKDSLSVVCNGKRMSGTIKPLNAEYNYERTVQYASVFAFIPDKKLSDKATVKISSARNYNNVILEKSYSGTNQVEERPDKIEAVKAMEIPYRSGTLLDVQILPQKAGAGKTLMVASDSPSIVSVGSAVVETDENGHASVLLKGNLPGKSKITLSLAGTGLSAETSVEVGSVSAGSQASSIEDGNVTVSLAQDSFVYDGTAREPEVTVIGLEEKDYIISYSENTNAGTAYAEVIGIGDYKGIISKPFTIHKAAQTVKASIEPGNFCIGDKKKISASGFGTLEYKSDKEEIAVVDEDGVVSGVGAGSAEITVTASGDANHNGASAKVAVTVMDKVNISVCTLELGARSYTYDGKKKEPAVTVKNGSVTLRKGTDYTVSYRNNLNAGTATAVVKGAGKYTGTLEKAFMINKANTTIKASNVTKTTAKKAKTFSLKAKCSRSGALTYSSKNKRVKVSKKGKVTIPKNFVGETQITIKAAASKNYKAAGKKITVKVNPAGVKITSAKSAASGKVTVKWKKNAKVSGYEIQYSTSKKFAKAAAKSRKVKKAAKTSETISKLKKGKTYYVRVRTYKKVAGKTYYSVWSGKKKVKINK